MTLLFQRDLSVSKTQALKERGVAASFIFSLHSQAARIHFSDGKSSKGTLRAYKKLDILFFHFFLPFYMLLDICHINLNLNMNIEQYYTFTAYELVDWKTLLSEVYKWPKNSLYYVRFCPE